MAEKELLSDYSQMLTVGEAAELLGITPRALNHAIERGRVPAKRFGTQWALTLRDVEAYRATRHAGGRPKKLIT